MDVLVKAGAALAFKAYATPDNAQLLRTIVWSLDVGDTARRPEVVAAAPSIDAENTAATEDVARATT